LDTIRLNRIAFVLILCALICACTSEPPKVGPKFSGRLLVLAGDKTKGADLFELTAAANSTYNFSNITGGVFEAAASPDQTKLLYATKNDVLLRDLRSGEVKSLVKGESFCLGWSTDSKRFSYKQNSEDRTKLYVSDLDGKTKLVWDDSSNNDGIRRSCAHWVAADKLIFDRLGLSQMKGGDVKPNTTTLGILDDSVRLADAERKWSVEGICPNGTAFLRSQEGQILIAKSLENLKTANPTSGPCSGCRFLGFAAQSCLPFFLEENSRDSSDLFYLNPANWQRIKAAHIGQTFSPAARMLINSSTRLMVVGDSPASLLLVDTESGDITPLFSKSAGPAGSGEWLSILPVVWIEK
jgi:hypothetical protein